MLRLLRCKLSQYLTYSTATAAPNPRPKPPPFVTDPTLTLYFLQKSCKLSPEAAATAAQEVNLKSTKNAHSILALLRDYGFSESHIVRLISSRPKLLIACPTRTLKPKIDFYASIGLSIDDFTNHFCTRDRLFLSSVKNRLAPNLRLLRLLLPSDADLLAAVRRYPAIILFDLQKVVPVKTNALLRIGMSTNDILKLIALHPRCLEQSPNEFDSSFAALKEMGINPSISTFAHVYGVFSKVPKLVWESRIQNFEKLGWSTDQVYGAFTRHPYCMLLSEEKVERNAKFFTEKLGWGPDRLSCSPVLISLSMEKRIGPRYRMFKLLEEKGFLKNGIRPKHIMLTEKRFMNLYVHKHQETVPEILEALRGNLGISSS